MAGSQLVTPTICPTSSPSSSPARNETHSVRGASESRDRGSNLVETLYSSVPDVGPDIEIDRGPMTKEYK